MREIKFRVFNELGLVAENVTLENAHYYVFDGDNITEQGPNVFVQFTGLKDKNGREIYEGDIVKGKYWTIGEVHRFVGQVKFLAPSFQVVGINQYRGMNQELHPLYEPIGNIYDNPELLEGDSK